MKNTVFLFLAVSALFCACNAENKDESTENDTKSETVQPSVPVSTEVIIFNNDTSRIPQAGGFGYLIKVNGNPFIFQPTIPAVSGNKGFASAEDAEKTGGLVAYKLRNNINPPSVTIAELDSLGIQK
ncbi:MAG: DUF4907 domain-containing protein [Bacteroidia bacterium]|nr:DUF4907 domain-containing protein [Bacteroidia bacterium]